MIDSQRLSEWIQSAQGQYINMDWEPTTEGYGAQCWDLAAHWSRFLGLPIINTGGAGRWPGWAGNMVDAFPQTAAIAAAYELIGPDQPGMPGDIPVWGDSYWYYPKTHVAVLVKDNGNGWLLCMSQNSIPSRADNPYPQWTTGPTTLQTLPKQGLIGYIRPRTGLSAQGTTTEEGAVMDSLTDKEDRRILEFADMGLDTPGRKPGPRLLTTVDGGYIVALLEGISAQIGHTLTKEDGGYIVGIVSALRPGATDTETIADAVIAAVGSDLAAEVVAKIGLKLGGE